MTPRNDENELLDLHALVEERSSSAPAPNESPHDDEIACDPLATVPTDLYLLTLRLSAADSLRARTAERESVASSLLPPRREGRTRLAITVALAAVLASGGTAIVLTRGGAATTAATPSAPTSPPAAHAGFAAPALALAQPTPREPSAMPNPTPTTMQAGTSLARPAPAPVARAHRPAVSNTNTDELAKPASVNAPSDAPTATMATTTEVAPDPTAAAAVAAVAPPSTEATATVEPSAPAAAPRAEEPVTLDEAMRSAVMGKAVQPSSSLQDVARGSERNATSGELQWHRERVHEKDGAFGDDGAAEWFPAPGNRVSDVGFRSWHRHFRDGTPSWPNRSRMAYRVRPMGVSVERAIAEVRELVREMGLEAEPVVIAPRAHAFVTARKFDRASRR